MALRIKRQPFIKSTLVFVCLLGALGFALHFQWVGYGLALAYAILAFILHVPFTRTFKLAIVLLTCVAIAIIFAAWQVAQNFAAYSFIFILIGTLQSTVDIKDELRARRSTFRSNGGS